MRAGRVELRVRGMTEAGRGHVFLVRGDLRTLVCDAVGFSGDERNEPSLRVSGFYAVGKPTEPYTP